MAFCLASLLRKPRHCIAMGWRGLRWHGHGQDKGKRERKTNGETTTQVLRWRKIMGRDKRAIPNTVKSRDSLPQIGRWGDANLTCLDEGQSKGEM